MHRNRQSGFERGETDQSALAADFDASSGEETFAAEQQSMQAILTELTQIRHLISGGSSGGPPRASGSQGRGKMPDDPSVFEGLLDWGLRRFITRRVTAILYTLVFWLTVGLTPFVAVGAYKILRGECYDSYCAGVAPGWAWLAFPSALLWMLISILIYRLQVERSVALVAIAQNTEPNAS